MNYPLLGKRKQKKALLKNSKNMEEIYKLYYEKLDYEIVYPDKIVIKQKYKYNTSYILNKFNINSNNELIFLLLRYFGKKIRTCEFCNEDMCEIQLRTTLHIENCRHEGICSLCKEPFQVSNEDGICYCCKPRIIDDNKPTTRNNNFLYSIESCSNIFNYLKENHTNEEELRHTVGFLEENLEIFEGMLMLKGFSNDQKDGFRDSLSDKPERSDLH